MTIMYTYLYTGVKTEEIEHILHINERLSHISIDRAKEIQWYGKLEEQTIHHHQVPYRHGACREQEGFV